MKLLSQTKSFGGWLKRYTHLSTSVNGDMTFAIYLPPQAENQSVPVLYWLSGLSCTDENFTQKAGAQRIAAELGMAIVCPDTSPRGTDFPEEHDSYDFGSGAGFYLNATEPPWNRHYRMYDYIVDELPSLLADYFPINQRCSISGHSMGGHGALTIALKNPQRYCSVSAFAPICHPTQCAWGEKAFSRYLGNDKAQWQQYDTTLLIAQIASQATKKIPILIDQGEADDFLASQLMPEKLQEACKESNYPLNFRLQKGYDHSYFFIASFIEEHLRYHAEKLG
ncbi:MAG: S-formylglutathione hydrolase [Candidatus Endobugula sp.]|jgi:S-formylglutathione hydrolase